MFQNGGIYHVYNRGVDKRVIFESDRYYKRFLLSMDVFNDVKASYSIYHKTRVDDPAKHPAAKEKIIEVLAFCLLPNHFHFLLRQEKEDGISVFMKKLMGGYTKYFNILNSRSGSLFQGKYKHKKVDSDFYLSHLAGYINGNAEIHGICKANEWPWSSYNDFISGRDSAFAKPSIVAELSSVGFDWRTSQEEIIRMAQKTKEDYRDYLLEM